MNVKKVSRRTMIRRELIRRSVVHRFCHVKFVPVLVHNTASCYFVTSQLAQQLRSRKVPEPDKTYVQGTFQDLESGDNCGWISNEIDGISTMSTSKALITDKSASCAWDRASSRTSNNWNRSIVGLLGSQSRTTVTEPRWRGNHAARPRLGNARRPKESGQAGQDVQDQHGQTTIPAAK